MLAVLLGLGSGCGSAAGRAPDVGDGSTTPDATVAGRLSFDVVAVLKEATDGGALNLPQNNSFTFVLDKGARQAIAGGNGQGAVIGLTSADGRTFRSTGGFTVGPPPTNSCDRESNVRYESFEVTVSGGGITGTATGAATVSCGDCLFMVPFTATWAGTADATPPALHTLGMPASNPFDSLDLAASEPLPASATARLVATDGTSIDLLPRAVDGPVPLITGFSKPDVVLNAGQGYSVSFDGLIDFAGRSDSTGVPLRLASFAAAPAVVEDGFESVTGSVFGGAMVARAGGPVPPIAGQTSLYIGGSNSPGLTPATAKSLTVRLSRQSGDSKLRFSFRLVSPFMSTYPVFVRVGSVGRSTGPIALAPPVSGTFQSIEVAGMFANASEIATMEAPLPADATDEVLVTLMTATSGCGGATLESFGVLIDDMRLE